MGEQTYTDEETGIRLVVEYDIPEYPKLTLFAPDNNTLTIEEVNAAVQRLMQMRERQE